MSWFDKPVLSDSSFDKLRMSGVEGLTTSEKLRAP
jgi:hypothetical protein